MMMMMMIEIDFLGTFTWLFKTRNVAFTTLICGFKTHTVDFYHFDLHCKSHTTWYYYIVMLCKSHTVTFTTFTWRFKTHTVDFTTLTCTLKHRLLNLIPWLTAPKWQQHQTMLFVWWMIDLTNEAMAFRDLGARGQLLDFDGGSETTPWLGRPAWLPFKSNYCIGCRTLVLISRECLRLLYAPHLFFLLHANLMKRP